MISVSGRQRQFLRQRVHEGQDEVCLPGTELLIIVDLNHFVFSRYQSFSEYFIIYILFLCFEEIDV